MQTEARARLVVQQWNGETVIHEEPALPNYAPDCYLCPGNSRVSGKRNDPYAGTFVFDNDHPCVGFDAPLGLTKTNGLYRNRPATDIARVVCYSPKHNVALAELERCEIENLLRVWQEQYVELGTREGVTHVLIFENKGEVVGVSNPHPHCQIYATNFVFKTIETEVRASQQHLAHTGRILFQDIIKAERKDGCRIIFENEFAIVFLPYFARYAYEAFVAPKKTHPSIASLTDVEVRDFACALKYLLVKLDNLWRMPFPYVMTLHQAPTDDGDHGAFHFHIEFHPPLRQPNLLKYLAGPRDWRGKFFERHVARGKSSRVARAARCPLQTNEARVENDLSLRLGIIKTRSFEASASC